MIKIAIFAYCIKPSGGTPSNKTT